MSSYSKIFSTASNNRSIYSPGMGNVILAKGLRKRLFRKNLWIFYRCYFEFPTVVFPTNLLCSVGSISIWIFLISCSSLKLATMASGQSLIDLLVWMFLRITCGSISILSLVLRDWWVKLCRWLSSILLYYWWSLDPLSFGLLPLVVVNTSFPS